MFLPLLGSCPWPAKIISPALTRNKQKKNWDAKHAPSNFEAKVSRPWEWGFHDFHDGFSTGWCVQNTYWMYIIIKRGMPKSLLLWCVTKMHFPPTLKIWETGSEISSYCWWKKEILHQLIGSLSHHLQFTRFYTSQVVFFCRISSIKRI